jgi:hypothetical protein
MNAMLLFLSTFAGVFCMGAQSLLVNNGFYMAAFGNSILIGSCQFLLFKLAPEASGLEVAAFLSGGPFGIVAAMIIFRSLHRK